MAAKGEDGSRIERLTGAGNGDDNGEYWRVTTVDGTQYLFGSRPAAESTWTVPVFGDDADEPCHEHVRGLALHPGVAVEPRQGRRPARQLMLYTYDTEPTPTG